MGRRDRRRKRKRSLSKPADPAAWALRTSAEFLTPSALMARKLEQGWHLLGVVGFAGAWRKGSQQLQADARQMLEAEFGRALAQHGDRLVVVSGATNAGVLQLTYAACQRMGIAAMGITAGHALSFDLAPMQFVVPVGQRFGEESPVFLAAIDEMVMLGGGGQSRDEAISAGQRGMLVTVIQGFGGTADELTTAELPGARWLHRSSE